MGRGVSTQENFEILVLTGFEIFSNLLGSKSLSKLHDRHECQLAFILLRQCNFDGAQNILGVRTHPCPYFTSVLNALREWNGKANLICVTGFISRAFSAIRFHDKMVIENTKSNGTGKLEQKTFNRAIFDYTVYLVSRIDLT